MYKSKFLRNGGYCVRRRAERAFENALRAHCREFGLDFETELANFKDWEKTERKIFYFCLALIVVCLFTL